MLRHLEGVAHEVPLRANVGNTVTEDLTAHYSENEVREAHGEARGCLGWPPNRAKKVRGYLQGLRNCIEAARKKWCTEENKIEARRKTVTEEIVKKALKNEERRKAFEARWNEIKARNTKALDEGTFEGPIVPIGFKPPEPPKQRQLSHEGAVDKVSFFAGAG